MKKYKKKYYVPFSLISRVCSWLSLTKAASLASISSFNWSNWWLKTLNFPYNEKIITQLPNDPTLAVF